MSLFGPNNTFLQIDEKKSSSTVGKDVKAYCSRCKLNLSHTIISVTSGNKPDRVRCNTCKTERAFRAPKKDIDIANGKEGGSMTDRDEEFDLDKMEVSKILLGDTDKKKSKAKSKAKKSKDDSEPKLSAKANAALPLSMQRGTPEDVATYETKLLQLKSQVANAKEYKASVRFSVGELISHKIFGIGYVVAESGLNKLEVLFKDGRKLLVTAPKS
jgi:hypothetical protein